MSAENQIFETLLKSSKTRDYNYDFPKLQPEAVDVAAEKFTEIIYETVKQKSTASHTKRSNILKYLHAISRVKPCHLNDNSFECFSRIIRKSLQSNEGDVSELGRQINSELETGVPTSLVDKMTDFYKRKRVKLKDKRNKLDVIDSMMQRQFEPKLEMEVRKQNEYHQVDENMIRDLLGCPCADLSEVVFVESQGHSVDYREQQVKFGYALINLKNSDLYLLEKIFVKLATYKELDQFEFNFLVYLWLLEDKALNFAAMIADRFPLVIEKVVKRYITEILQLKDEEVYQYFTNLENDKTLAKIRRTCAENIILNKSLKNLVYESYFSNSCNETVFKLISFLQ
ncbi:hypothetical protein NQ315_000263 [Exocentrus adspersus]|uniref:Uncharacterized protein n=1 Tax=Exocentrus adspersus TaxID=1586481 RepID=A0AAV8VQQ4_9CUCU|nr:hypothetical protein NQ315_000263 [Exocentrus adspersus]